MYAAYNTICIIFKIYMIEIILNIYHVLLFPEASEIYIFIINNGINKNIKKSTIWTTT